MEDFTEVGAKRERIDTESSDEEIFKVPNALGIKIVPKGNEVKTSFNKALGLMQSASQSSMLIDDVEALKELMSPNNSKRSLAGWNRNLELNLTCL